MLTQNSSTITEADGEGLMFQVRPGAKAAVVTGLIGLFALGLFAIAVGLVVENPARWGKALSAAGIGCVLSLWFVFEARGFLFTERYYLDRAECVRGGNVVKCARFDDDGFKFSYGIRTDGSDATLMLSGPDGANFTLIAGAGPESTDENIARLRDHLSDVVADRIARTLAGGGQFEIDPAWTLARGGAEIDGQHVPWSELRVAANNATGQVTLCRGNAAIAKRWMMDDNVLAVLSFLASRRDAGEPTTRAA